MATYAYLQSGFYNSINGDRRYSAEDFGTMMDCFMPYNSNTDVANGVIANEGDEFSVYGNDANRTVTIGSGKAWYDGIWINNRSKTILEVPVNATGTTRSDVVFIEIDRTPSAEGRKVTVRYEAGITEAALKTRYNETESKDMILLATVGVTSNNQLSVTKRTYTVDNPGIDIDSTIINVGSGFNINNLIHKSGKYIGTINGTTGAPTHGCNNSTMYLLEVMVMPHPSGIYAKQVVQRLTLDPRTSSGKNSSVGMFIRYITVTMNADGTESVGYGNWQRYGSRELLIKNIDYYDTLPTANSNRVVGELIFVKASS